MDFFSDQQRVSAPRWTEVVDDGAMPETPLSKEAELILLRQRVKELEATVADYEALLADLPDLFERKFQQRLEPLLERYRLLARAQHLLDAPDVDLTAKPLESQERSPFMRWRSNARRIRRHPNIDTAA